MKMRFILALAAAIAATSASANVVVVSAPNDGSQDRAMHTCGVVDEHGIVAKCLSVAQMAAMRAEMQGSLMYRWAPVIDLPTGRAVDFVILKE